MKKGDDLHKIDDLISRLAEELESTDILIQINAVEMFADGASQLVFACEEETYAAPLIYSCMACD